MSRASAAFVLGMLAVVTLAMTLSTGASQPPPVQKKAVFSTLKVGQSVTLKDKGAAWEIHTTDDEAPQTHKVVEAGEDYIVLHDEPGAVETRIPVTAVRAVVHVRTKGK
jgi:Spy/CpxP family protein refolding chaperone